MSVKYLAITDMYAPFKPPEMGIVGVTIPTEKLALQQQLALIQHRKNYKRQTNSLKSMLVDPKASLFDLMESRFPGAQEMKRLLVMIMVWMLTYRPKYRECRMLLKLLVETLRVWR